MSQPTPAQLRRTARERQIVEIARTVAELDGWPAVTVRRLADAIGYSQPVLYGHFPDGRDGIVRAVALDGFGRIAAALAGAERVEQIARRYLDFARENPAVYEAMFSMPIGVPFATAQTPATARAAFAAIKHVVTGPAGDSQTSAEVLWSALHGIAELSRHKRLRASHEAARIKLLVGAFTE